MIQVRALARKIVLCSWARHLTLTVPLSTHVYACKPVGTSELMLGGNSAVDPHPIQEEVEIFLVASRYRHWDKLQFHGPHS